MQIYNSDLSDSEWDLLSPHFSKEKKLGRKSHRNMRVVLNAIFYRLRTGCQWRMLPKEYGSWEAIFGYWYRWSKNGFWQKINDALRDIVRSKDGKSTNPTAAIIDSQSVKTVQKGGL